MTPAMFLWRSKVPWITERYLWLGIGRLDRLVGRPLGRLLGWLESRSLAWTEDTSESFSSFVNSIPTAAGGTHENGLKSGMVKAVRNYLDIHNLVPRGLQIAAEDVREGVVGLLSCFISDQLV